MNRKNLISSVSGITIYASLLLVFLFTSYSLADIYTWTDENGVVHFTDDPQKASRKAIRPSMTATETTTPDVPDIVGRWSNRKESFSAVVLVFNADNTGQMLTPVVRMPFQWVAQGNGHFLLELRDQPGLAERGAPMRIFPLTAEYDSTHDYIVVVAKDVETKKDKTIKFFPEDDKSRQEKEKRDRKAGRVHAPKWLKFSQTTADFPSLGLTSVRDLNLPGSQGPFSSAHSFIAQINSQSYGGNSDWRLPSREEMNLLILALQHFANESGKQTWSPEVLEWIGFINPRRVCYWTSTEGYVSSEQSVLMFDGVERSLSRQEKCSIWPIRGKVYREK